MNGGTDIGPISAVLTDLVVRIPYPFYKYTNGWCFMRACRKCDSAMKRRPGSSVLPKAYRYWLQGDTTPHLFVGARNKPQAVTSLAAMYGDRLQDVRVHPLSDPWAQPVKAQSLLRR